MTKRIYNLKMEDLLIEHLDFLQLEKPKFNLPAIVDLRNKMPAVYDQGNLGSCTANALCGLVGYVKPAIPFGSRLFVYYNERKIENTISEDAGATLSSGIKCLKKYGVCQESEWSYDISKFTVRPPQKCYDDALQNIALQVKNIPKNKDSMKNSLFNGNPFVVGFLVYESFESQKVANTGYVPLPKLGKEKLLGGHAVTCVGYDENKQVWIMRNSWGTGWGENGYFYMPYKYLTSDLASGAFWTITKMK